MLEWTQYFYASQSRDIVFLPRSFLSEPLNVKKVYPDGSGLENMLSAVDKRNISNHVTGLGIKISILHKF